MVRFSDEMNRFGGGWLTFLHNLSTSIFYWQWHFFIICLRLSSIFSVERHKVQFYVLIQPQIGSYPYLIFVDLMIVTNMSYALTVMIRPQRSCLGPWIISQEVPGNDTSEHNPFKKYFNPLHNTKTSSFSTSTTKKNITSKKNRNKISITTNMKVTKTQSINLRQWNRVPDVDWTLWLQSWHQESLLQRFNQGSNSVKKLVDYTSWSDVFVNLPARRTWAPKMEMPRQRADTRTTTLGNVAKAASTLGTICILIEGSLRKRSLQTKNHNITSWK